MDLIGPATRKIVVKWDIICKALDATQDTGWTSCSLRRAFRQVLRALCFYLHSFHKSVSSSRADTLTCLHNAGCRIRFSNCLVNFGWTGVQYALKTAAPGLIHDKHCRMAGALGLRRGSHSSVWHVLIGFQGHRGVISAWLGALWLVGSVRLGTPKHLPSTGNCPCSVAQSCLTRDPVDCSPPGSSVRGDSPSRNARVGCHGLLQGIFPTQGSNPGPPHCRQILHPLSHQGSPDLEQASSVLALCSPTVGAWAIPCPIWLQLAMMASNGLSST